MCYNCCHLQSSLRSTAHEYRSVLCLLKTTEAGLGRKRQGQRRPGAGGEGASRHHHQGAVAARREASELPRTQVQPPAKSRKLLPAQRPHQVQDVQHAAHRQVRPERQVLLLRLLVEHQARQGRLQDSHAQHPPLRGAGGQQDSLQHSH